MFAEIRRTVNRTPCAAHLIFQSAHKKIHVVIFLPVVKVYKWIDKNECKDGRMTTDIIYNDCKEANGSTNE